MIGCGWPPAADRGRSAVGQIVLFDLIAVGLEQHCGAAQLADLLLGALDHAVTLAGLLVEYHPGRSHLEALFGAGFGLELGHLALLCGGRHGPAGRICSFERAESPSPRQPFLPGGGRAALWQRPPRNTTMTRVDRRQRQRGASTITTWRPSKRGSCST